MTSPLINSLNFGAIGLNEWREGEVYGFGLSEIELPLVSGAARAAERLLLVELTLLGMSRYRAYPLELLLLRNCFSLFFCCV